MARFTLNPELWPPVPEGATPEEIENRFFATVHCGKFYGNTPSEVMRRIDEFEEERTSGFASYIVFDRFEAVTS